MRKSIPKRITELLTLALLSGLICLGSGIMSGCVTTGTEASMEAAATGDEMTQEQQDAERRKKAADQRRRMHMMQKQIQRKSQL